MAGYERQIATAKRLIAKRGQAVFWNVRPVATADSSEVEGASKWRPKAAPLQPQLSFPVTIAFFPVDRNNYESLTGRGIELTSGSQLGYMAAVGFEPSQKDTVTRNGHVLPVSHIEIIAPNGDAILYEIVFAAPVILGAQNG